MQQFAKLLVVSVAVAIVCASATAQGQIDSNAVMGFESPLAWAAQSCHSCNTTVSSTTTRTQGSYAYSVTNPGNLVTLTSAPVASTATALAGVGNNGAIFEVDVLLPTEVGNTNNPGKMQMFVNSRSLGLNNVHIGDVDFSSFRAGIYNTLQFPIPSAVVSALGGASFSDLTFLFQVHSPGQMTGSYLFDNLRVHYVPLVTANSSTTPPPGYGGSVDFVVIGGTPVAQSFNVGPVQVPNGFHLKLGTTGTTSVQLQLGYEGTPSFTCTYDPDSTDTTNTSYILSSCTGGMQAGDLVPTDWAQLAIVSGNSTMKLRAQLARNPVGDTIGAGIIPAIPTFWGDFNSCVPATVAGNVVPPYAPASASCAAQTSQTNQIVSNYSNQLDSPNVAPNWVVTPKPEFAKRHSNGSANNNLVGPPPPNDPPFDQEGHMNPGGTFDAYWRLSGDLESSNTVNNTFSQQNSSLETDFSAHAVLFGQDVNIASLNAHVDTSTSSPGSQFTFQSCDGNTHPSPGAVGCVSMYFLGTQIAGGDNLNTGNLAQTFTYKPSANQDYNLPPIQIWIFDITLGATASVGLDAELTIAGPELHAGITPNATAGAHMEGGVNLGIASGGVDARVELLKVDTPFNADATWLIDTSPTKCSATWNFNLDGRANISAGGGEVDLVASFGPCPFCVDDSWTLFSWDPVLSYPQQLFDIPVTQQSFRLPDPTQVCTSSLNVSTGLQNGANIPSNLPVSLNGSASTTNVTVTCGNIPGTDRWLWSFNPSINPPPAEAFTDQGCNSIVTFASAPLQRTIGLSVQDTVQDQFQRPIPLSGSATPVTVNLFPVPAGVYITELTMNDGRAFSTTPCSGGNCSPASVTYFPFDGWVSPFTLMGQVVSPPAGTLNTTWTVTNTDTNQTCSSSDSPPTCLSSPDPTSSTQTVTWTPSQGGHYTITMVTTVTDANGTRTFGSPSITVYLYQVN